MFSVKLPNDLELKESIVLPISMSQTLEKGEALAAILRALDDAGLKKNVTILICDYLNRHNCSSEEEALEMGNQFIRDHEQFLSGFKVIRWKEYIDSKPEFDENLKKIEKASSPESLFYGKMAKTHQQCFSSDDLVSSIQYQKEECAAILCMDEFDSLIYPRKMNLCLRYFYSNINGHKPSYYRLNISGSKTQNNGLIEYSVFSDKNKESTSMPLALRMLYDQCEFVLHSSEISVRSKLLFIENMNGLFNSQPSLKNQFMKTHNSMNYFNT